MLTSGVWSSALAAASAWCSHEAGAASDEHDCCRADIGDSNAHHAEAADAPHDAAPEHPTTRNQPAEAHAGMNCSGAHASPPPESAPVALVQAGRTCAECCAGGSGQTPATVYVIAPEQNKVKRDAGGDSAGASALFASSLVHVSHLAPTQHAPPVPPERRHILIGVFRI